MLNLVLSLSLSHTGHWKFNMAPHGKGLFGDREQIIVALHKDGVGYKKIAKTLKMRCSTVDKTIQWFIRTGSTQNRHRHGRPKKLSAHAQRHIQRLCLGNRRISGASISAEVEGVEGQPVSAQTMRRTLHQIDLHDCCPRGKPLLKMIHKKVCKQFAEDKQTKDTDYWNHVLWSDETKINLFGSDGVKRVWWQPGEEYKDKEFAEDNQTKDKDYWNHALWSDETKIKVFGLDGVKCVVATKVRSTKTSVSCLQSSMVVGVSWSGDA